MGLFFGEWADAVREAPCYGIRTIGVGRQEAAAVRGTDLEPGKAVQRAFKDQVRQGDGGFEGVADGVGQQAAAGEPAARFQFAGAERVQEDEGAEFLAFGPERMEAGIGEFLAGDAAGDADAAKTECFDGVFNLLRGEIGVLQGGGGEGDEAVGVGGAEFHQCFVLYLYQLGGDVAFGAVPVGVDAEGFHVDALRIHRGDAGAGVGHQQSG